MRKVFKYHIPIAREFDLDMPAGAKILTAQMQGGESMLWAMVNPSNAKVVRHFRIAGTGHAIDCENELAYINTFQTDHGALVWHLFEVNKPYKSEG